GLVLLECFTGRREYPGMPLEAAVARLCRPPAIPAALPEPWPQLLAALTEPDPADRPPAHEVVEWLTAPSGQPPAWLAGGRRRRGGGGGRRGGWGGRRCRRRGGDDHGGLVRCRHRPARAGDGRGRAGPVRRSGRGPPGGSPDQPGRPDLHAGPDRAAAAALRA